jgi:hypothetical protein
MAMPLRSECCSIRSRAQSPRYGGRRVRRCSCLPYHRRAGSCRSRDHSATLNGDAERDSRDGAHSAGSAPPADPGAGSARLAEGGELRPSVVGRGGDNALQDRDRPPPPRPDFADAKGRSRRLQGDQHHDPPLNCAPNSCSWSTGGRSPDPAAPAAFIVSYHWDETAFAV